MIGQARSALSSRVARLMDQVQMLRPLRHRDFGLLWAGMTISLLGDGAFQVALAWQVYLLSDTPTALSIVGAAATLPHVVFVLLAGILADRFERRRVLIVADALRGVAVAKLKLVVTVIDGAGNQRTLTKHLKIKG